MDSMHDADVLQQCAEQLSKLQRLGARADAPARLPTDASKLVARLRSEVTQLQASLRQCDAQRRTSADRVLKLEELVQQERAELQQLRVSMQLLQGDMRQEQGRTAAERERVVELQGMCASLFGVIRAQEVELVDVRRRQGELEHEAERLAALRMQHVAREAAAQAQLGTCMSNLRRERAELRSSMARAAELEDRARRAEARDAEARARCGTAEQAHARAEQLVRELGEEVERLRCDLARMARESEQDRAVRESAEAAAASLAAAQAQDSKRQRALERYCMAAEDEQAKRMLRRWRPGQRSEARWETVVCDGASPGLTLESPPMQMLLDSCCTQTDRAGGLRQWCVAVAARQDMTIAQQGVELASLPPELADGVLQLLIPVLQEQSGRTLRVSVRRRPSVLSDFRLSL